MPPAAADRQPSQNTTKTAAARDQFAAAVSEKERKERKNEKDNRF